MTNRPMLTKKARLACEHLATTAIRSDLPDSWGGRQWCRACGCFFEEGSVNWEAVVPPEDRIDWPATDSADASQMEREGQMRPTSDD
jgi:hypothetical protein